MNKFDGMGNGVFNGLVNTIVPVGIAHVGCWVTLTIGTGHGVIVKHV